MVDLTETSAAARLVGLTLNNKWHVIREVPKGNTTGGYFSYGYIVRSPTGEEAFLKALDLARALREPNWMEAVKNMTTAHVYERDILFKCRDRRMTRVVRAIDQGEELVPGAFPPQVSYLVFELAEGDVRQKMSDLSRGGFAWTLRTLHHTATGLYQLHRGGIAHQDMKPSNVLVFEGGSSQKVADLGRASSREQAALHDNLSVPGDYSYAPPELLYNQVSAEWVERRFSCDLYHLGSLAMFLFVKVSATPAILGRLSVAEHPKNWGGTYSEILPRVQSAFEDVLVNFKRAVQCDCGEEIVQAVRQLCNPDPMYRGHPLNRFGVGSQFSLERYVSLFNRLAKRAELGLREH
jgi:serine/threonine protein kinase